LNKVLGEVRRISHNLRPAILDDLGLAAALDHLVQEFNDSSSAQASFAASPATAGEGLPDMVNTVLFRIAQEALTNIERHANASRIEVSLHGDEGVAGAVELRIADNGGGFDFDGIALHPQRGIGLRNMTERMEAIGGSLHIASTPAGTVVLARLDLQP
jgi:two-component system NarL family sensor kinase